MNCDCGHVEDEHEQGGLFQPCTIEGCDCGDFEEHLDEYEQALLEVQRLRAALEQYGRHSPDTMLPGSPEARAAGCTCPSIYRYTSDSRWAVQEINIACPGHKVVWQGQARPFTRHISLEAALDAKEAR